MVPNLGLDVQYDNLVVNWAMSLSKIANETSWHSHKGPPKRFPSHWKIVRFAQNNQGLVFTTISFVHKKHATICYFCAILEYIVRRILQIIFKLFSFNRLFFDNDYTENMINIHVFITTFKYKWKMKTVKDIVIIVGDCLLS